jgi:hypothetical protein
MTDVAVFVIRGVDLLFHLPHVDVCHCIDAVEDACDLLERRALGLDVEEVDEDKFAEVPGLRILVPHTLLTPSGCLWSILGTDLPCRKA